MAKFLPGHRKVGGRKKGSTNKSPTLGTIREFLEAKAWNPLSEVFEMLPKLSEYQQARINMEIVAMEMKERLVAKLGSVDAPKGEVEEAKRLSEMTTDAFISSLPVKLDGHNGNGTHPGPKA